VTLGFSDEPHIERIAEALWAREPVGSAALLVGAGFSRNAAPIRASVGVMPGWNDIYAIMVNKLYPDPGAGSPTASIGTPSRGPEATVAGDRAWLLKQTGATSAYLRVAEEFEAQFGRDALDKLILRHVPDRQFAPGKLHNMLVQLPWADVMTTNWDTLLERATESAEERVYDVLRTVEELPEARAPRIIKLHGSFPSHRPFIFTEEDFRTYPVRFGPFVNLAQQLAMENTLVLLGFSGDDPNFLFWSGWVRDRLGPKAPLIYLVGALGLSAPKRRMLENRRIQPIDLARLPEFNIWPEPLRTAHAHQWFLERLRAAEPYPAQRWPRPAAGFVPPLIYIMPPTDSRAPIADPDLPGQTPAVETLRSLVLQWQQNRSVYPGWIIPPFETSKLLWGRIEHRLDEIITGLRALDEEERLEALYELNWQLEMALVPLILTVDDFIMDLLDAWVGRYDQLPAHQAKMFRALALAIVRHAREENDPVLFVRWLEWLEPRLAGDVEARERLTYERCLQHRANLEIDALETLVLAWKVEGDSFWLLRKAGLLADLGHNEEASSHSSDALNAIRAQTVRGTQDISSWSRESFAMLFRSSVLYGELAQWQENKPVRDRFDLRQEQLQARGCPGRHDFFDLLRNLVQVPPPFKQPVENNHRFDLGSNHVTHRFGRLDSRTERLLAYQALRFLEEAGLPVRIGHAGVAAQLLSEVARWLMDVAPTRAIDAFLRASLNATDGQFDQLMTRATVARINADEADRLIDRVIRLIGAARVRVETKGPHSGFWKDRLKSTIEVASRIVLRAPARAPELLTVALELHGLPIFKGRSNLAQELQRLVNRVIEAATLADRDAMLLALFQLPILASEDDFARDENDLAADISADIDLQARGPEWDGVIADTIAAMEDATTRVSATSRFNWMMNVNLLNDEQRQRFGAVLWASKHRENGLPTNTIFYPHAFLILPRPADIDVQAAVSSALLFDVPLSDSVVVERALANAFAVKEFLMNEAQIVCELKRLYVFVVGHPPAPDHPDFFGNERDDLVDFCARMVAGLAFRSLAYPVALATLRELVVLDCYPLRLDAAIPSLVKAGILSVGEAAERLRTMLADNDAVAPRLLGAFLDNVLVINDPDPDFEKAMWSELALAVAARRPSVLARILRFIAHIIGTDPVRIPVALDDTLSIGLDLIRSETGMAAPQARLGYDTYLVRFFSASLVTAMDKQGRGDRAVLAAWREAIDQDPLPDTRRARYIATHRVKSNETNLKTDDALN
jgi:hypothetical protein